MVTPPDAFFQLAMTSQASNVRHKLIWTETDSTQKLELVSSVINSTEYRFIYICRSIILIGCLSETTTNNNSNNNSNNYKCIYKCSLNPSLHSRSPRVQICPVMGSDRCRIWQIMVRWHHADWADSLQEATDSRVNQFSSSAIWALTRRFREKVLWPPLLLRRLPNCPFDLYL